MRPRDFPLRSTVQGYFYRWRDDGTWARINHHLLLAVREVAGREASPSAGVIDSQSVRTTEARYDAGKKVNGRKRHILTDTLGLLVTAIRPFRRHSGPGRCRSSHRSAAFPWLRRVFADGGYAGEKLRGGAKRAGRRRRLPDPVGRWVVERTLAWLNRNRRLAKDFDNPSPAPNAGS